MNAEELKIVLESHKKWLNDEDVGQRADLYGADLSGANLRGADLDYSSGLPMSCSGLRVNIDDRIAVQLLYHCLNNVMHSKNVSLELKKALLTAENCRIANKFHRVKDCGKIEVYDEKV